MEQVQRARSNTERKPRFWGLGGFENEIAVRWVETLEDADLEMVESTLDELLEGDENGSVQLSLCSEAIAAAETVAALADEPAESLPEEVRQWCFDNPGHDLGEVRAKAVQALGMIVSGSALSRFFDEKGQFDEWELELEGLRDRLR